MTLNISDSRRIRDFLADLTPENRAGVTHRVMVGLTELTAANAATEQIKRGRGNSPALRTKLTWRTGNLTRSIGIDNSRAPDRYVVGSTANYAPVHELGFTGIVTVRSHQREIAFGRRIAGGFTVPTHRRQVRIPKRPFLKPAATKILKKEAPKLFARALGRAGGAETR